MDLIKVMMDTQLTEREIIIFLLVDSGMAYRDIAKRLLTNPMNITRTYENARKKLDKMGGLMSTELIVN